MMKTENIKKIISFALLLLSGLSISSFAKNTSDADRLTHGDVIVRQIQQPSTQNGIAPTVEAEILLAYPAEKVWPTLSEPEKLLRDEPKVRKVKVISRVNHQQTIAMNVTAGFLLPPFNYVLLQELSPPNLIRFHRISGSFKDIQGSWRLIPFRKGETLLVYTLKLDPGPFIPHGLMNMAVQSDLPSLMKNVKHTIEQNVATNRVGS